MSIPDGSQRREDSSPLLLLLDGVLSQDEPRMISALQQIQSLDPSLKDLCKSPLRSSSALERIVQRLLSMRPELAEIASQSDGSTPLHFSASIGNINVAKWLLEKYPASALMHNKKGKIPLHYAAREGRIDMVRFLLERVPESAAVMTHKLKLPIHFAAGDGHVEVVRALLQANPTGASTPSKKGKAALHFAARWGHLAIAKDLYSICPPTVKILDLDGNVPLHDAAREGQLEMAKFLVKLYPEGMCKTNIRGELPLFGAIRSGNVDLCAFLIRSWPESGKKVLQMVRSEDNVASWDPSILDLCLRGAVGNFTDLPPLRQRDLIRTYDFSSKVALKSGETKVGRPRAVSLSDRGSSGGSSGDASIEVATISSSATASPYASSCPMDRLTPGLDITLPRSKSPVLQDDSCGKKRSSSEGTNCNKKSRRGSSIDFQTPDAIDMTRRILATRTFYQLHVALECLATCSVLECIIDRHADRQLRQVDDHGKLPLHIAMEHPGSDERTDLVLSRVWEPFKEASFYRDYLGRLPLHIALASKADSRIIEALLKQNPSGGVDHCDAVDPRFGEKLPLHVATENNCDLSTIFLLMKVDPSVVQSWNCF